MKNLPIMTCQEDIVNAVKNNAVTIISAPTGTGKSTQVSQFLADRGYKVVVTQPRIMAAKTLATAVADEMDVCVGKEVGFRTSYDKSYSADTRICYVTDGLQLVRTIFDEEEEANTVLIIDEVHEWNLNIETLVAWCKSVISKRNMKLVLMSATMDVQELAAYFNNCKTAIVSVMGKQYPVTVEERREDDLISTIMEQISAKQNVLVFVPGKREIEMVIENLEDANAVVLPLHGELDWVQQSKCFTKYDLPKVIVATNVAQTSITIPDIDVVVDTGTARISIAENGIQGLFLKPISKADITQRMGRAGRTHEGKYILCSNTPISERAEYMVPEIERSILSRVVLQLSAIGIDAENLEFFHQPKVEAIKAAKKELVAIGAMDANYQITPIGHQISRIPLSVHLARMVVEAKKYGVVKPVITIAAIVEMGGLLSKTGEYSRYTREDVSDLLAEYDVWSKLEEIGMIDFERAGINKKNYFRIKNHISKLISVLKDNYLYFEDGSLYGNREAILKSCLTGWTNYIFTKILWDEWKNGDGPKYQVNKKSCADFYGEVKAAVGIPMTIEYTSRWGSKEKLNLLSFVTYLTKEQLCELVPNEIVTVEKLEYNESEDAVNVTTEKRFRDVVLESETEVVFDHPQYEEVRKQYREIHYDWQKTVMIAGKEFTVIYYSREKLAYVYLDLKTVEVMTEEQIVLENGMVVELRTESGHGKTLTELRERIREFNILHFEDDLRYKLALLKISTFKKVLEHREYIGAIDLSCGVGTPRYIYGGLELFDNAMRIKLFEYEELAEFSTKQTLSYLFIKEAKELYTVKKFRTVAPTRKKEALSKEDAARMNEFFEFVNELAKEISLENYEENMVMLAMYFEEIMNKAAA